MTEDNEKKIKPEIWKIILLGVVLTGISAALLLYVNKYYTSTPPPSSSLGENIPFQYNDLLYYPPRSAEKIFFQALVVFIPGYLFIFYAFITNLKLKFKIIVNIILVLLFFGITEHFMRIAALDSPIYTRPHPVMMWENNPGFKNKTYRFNSQGFRNEEIPVKKEPNEKRAIILGDSTPFGHNLPQEETIAYRLMKHLNDDSRGKTRWTVINAALQATTSYQGRYIFEKKGMKFHPDIIIIAYNNDPRRDILSEKERPGPRFLLPFKILLYKSEIYLLFKKHLVKQYIIKNKDYLSDVDNMTKPRISREEFAENLEAIIKEGEKIGAKTLVIALPHNPSMEPSSDEKVEYRDLMRDIPKRNNQFFYNLYDEFRKIDKSEKYFVDIHHLNVEGSRTASEMIYNYIKENEIDK